VMIVPRRSDSTDNNNATGPEQTLTPIGPNIPLPSAIIDFSQCGQDLPANIAVSRQDGGRVLDNQNPGVPNLT
jgi:hypothetical protein